MTSINMFETFNVEKSFPPIIGSEEFMKRKFIGLCANSDELKKRMKQEKEDEEKQKLKEKEDEKETQNQNLAESEIQNDGQATS